MMTKKDPAKQVGQEQRDYWITLFFKLKQHTKKTQTNKKSVQQCLSVLSLSGHIAKAAGIKAP